MGRNWAYIQLLIDSDSLAADTKELLKNWRVLRETQTTDKECERLASKPLFCTYRGYRFRCIDIAASGFVSLIRIHDRMGEEIDVLVVPELCTDWATHPH